MDKICSITDVEWKQDKKGRDYAVYSIKDEQASESNHAVYDAALQKLLTDAFKGGRWLNITLEKQGDFWNLTGAVEIADQIKVNPNTLTPQRLANAPDDTGAEPVLRKTRNDEITENMFWKILSDWLLEKEKDKGADPYWKLLRSAFLAKMLSVLDIKVGKEEQ